MSEGLPQGKDLCETVIARFPNNKLHFVPIFAYFDRSKIPLVASRFFLPKHGRKKFDFVQEYCKPARPLLIFCTPLRMTRWGDVYFKFITSI